MCTGTSRCFFVRVPVSKEWTEFRIATLCVRCFFFFFFFNFGPIISNPLESYSLERNENDVLWNHAPGVRQELEEERKKHSESKEGAHAANPSMDTSESREPIDFRVKHPDLTAFWRWRTPSVHCCSWWFQSMSSWSSTTWPLTVLRNGTPSWTYACLFAHGYALEESACPHMFDKCHVVGTNQVAFATVLPKRISWPIIATLPSHLCLRPLSPLVCLGTHNGNNLNAELQDCADGFFVQVVVRQLPPSTASDAVTYLREAPRLPDSRNA